MLNHFGPRQHISVCLFFQILRKSTKLEWTFECEEAFSQLKKYLSQPSLLSKPQLGQILYLYLAISAVAVSVVLVREEGHVQLLVYYINHFMLSVKTKYPSMKKLALALLVMSRKLRPYFQAYVIVMFTRHNLR